MEFRRFFTAVWTTLLFYIIQPIQCAQKIYLTNCIDSPARYEGYRSGTIVSQQRGNYTSGIDCRVTIGVPEGYNVRLRFSKFELQHSADGICKDFVQIFEGENIYWKPLTSKLCGHIMPAVVTSKTNYVTIWWKTDFTQENRYPGWQLEFRRRRGYTVGRRYCLACNSSSDTSSCFRNTTYSIPSVHCTPEKQHCYSLGKWLNRTGEFVGVERGCFPNNVDIECPEGLTCSHYRCNQDNCNTSEYPFFIPLKDKYVFIYRTFLRIFYGFDTIIKGLLQSLFGLKL